MKSHISFTILKAFVLTLVSVTLTFSFHLRVIHADPSQIYSTPNLDEQWKLLMLDIQKYGVVNVDVSFKAPAWHSIMDNPLEPIASMTSSQRDDTLLNISEQLRTQLLADLSSYNYKIMGGMGSHIPGIILRVDQRTLFFLKTLPIVKAISGGLVGYNADSNSTTQIGANWMWNASPITGGYTGNGPSNGQIIAVLDSGVQDTHPFFQTSALNGSRILINIEGCFSGTMIGFTSICPNGGTTDIGHGAAIPCNLQTISPDCFHGTWVAGIAAGFGTYPGGFGENGIAQQALILPVQIESLAPNPHNNYKPELTFDYHTDLLNALMSLEGITTYSTYHLAAINLSVGDGLRNPQGTCENMVPMITDAVQWFSNRHIAVVAATGNQNITDGMNYPACIKNVISVGATDFSDHIAQWIGPVTSNPYGSNYDQDTTIFAPGVDICSSYPLVTSSNSCPELSAVPNTSYLKASGTSASAPQVSGAIALLQQEANNQLSIYQLKAILAKTGRSIDQYGHVRLDLGQAGIVAVQRQATVGIYRGNTFYLKNVNTFGYADQTVSFGNGTDAYPVVGDWSGMAFFDELGVYNRGSGVFTLCNVTTTQSPVNNTACGSYTTSSKTQVALGNPGDYPLSGRWNPRALAYSTNASGIVYTSNYSPTGIGVYRSNPGLALLKNLPTAGYADFSVSLGAPGDIVVAGDWDNDGQGSIGVYRPSTAYWYLSNEVTNSAVPSDIVLTYGSPGAADLPVVGNWLTQDVPALGVGVYRTSTGYYLLRNSLTTGFNDIGFAYGAASDLPIVGHWSLSSAIPQPQGVPSHSNLPPAILIPSTPQNPQYSGGSVPGGNGISG